MTDTAADQLGGHARLRSEIIEQAVLVERLGRLLQGVAVVLGGVGLVAALFIGFETRCVGGAVDPGGTSSCLAGTTHPYVAQAVGLATVVLLLVVGVIALAQLMIVAGKFCSYPGVRQPRRLDQRRP